MPISPSQAASLVAHLKASGGIRPADRASLEAMGDDAIDAAARSDPDAQPATPDALRRAVEAREHRRRASKKAI